MTRNPVEDGENFSAVYWSAITNAVGNEYIDNGCTPTNGTGDLDVDIASGDVYVAGGSASVSSQTVTVSSSGTDDRVDIITINSSGSASVTEGTEAADPNAPSIPTDEVLVAAVHVRGGSSSLSPSDIKDYRILNPNPYAVDSLSEIDATDLGQSGSDGQVLEIGQFGSSLNWSTRTFEDAADVTLVDSGSASVSASSSTTIVSQRGISGNTQIMAFARRSGAVDAGLRGEVAGGSDGLNISWNKTTGEYNVDLENSEGTQRDFRYAIWEVDP